MGAQMCGCQEDMTIYSQTNHGGNLGGQTQVGQMHIGYQPDADNQYRSFNSDNAQMKFASPNDRYTSTTDMNRGFAPIPRNSQVGGSASSSQKLSSTLILPESALAEFASLPTIGPIMYPSDSSTYKGQVLDSQRHGRGMLVQADGSYYDGLWRKGLRDGFGRAVDAKTGCVYEGEFKRDRFHGFGVLYNLTTGFSFEGKWVDGKQHGFGVEHWDDGSLFEGDYVQGVKQGKGIFRWGNGCAYQGDFAGDKLEGYGIYTWQDGRKYEGEWKANQFHGEGRYELPGKLIYQGRYVLDRKHGYGTLHKLNTGEIYKGEWNNGEKHGKGRLEGSKEHSGPIEGIWERGRLVNFELV